MVMPTIHRILTTSAPGYAAREVVEHTDNEFARE